MTASARAELRRAETGAAAGRAAGWAERPTEHEQLGFEIGWDHARHGVELPSGPFGAAAATAPLHDGFAAGRAAFGARALQPTPPVHRWLRLRLHAWLNARSLEPIQVTPRHLQQIEVRHCPITRAPLAYAAAPDSPAAPPDSHAASLDRVRHDAGYAAGNLVWMSRRANRAKAALDRRGALAMADAAPERQRDTAAQLSPTEWRRVAALCSFVEDVPHADACALPLSVLPPNRLRLFNPAQALQAMLSRQLLHAGWSRRVSRFEELLCGKSLARDLERFMMALLPRVLEAGPLADGQPTRWAIEDAWHVPLVQQRWFAFASQLTAPRCDTLLRQAAAHGLATLTVTPMTDVQATDGWNLASGGRLVSAGAGAGDADAACQRQAQLAF